MTSSNHARLENIGPKGRRRRLVGGLVALGGATAMATVLIAIAAPPVWRLVTVVPLYLGLLGVLQAGGKTWVVLAARGARNMNGGEEPIADRGRAEALRRRATWIYLAAVAGATVAGALLVVVPI